MDTGINFWSIFGSLTGFAALMLHFWRYLQEKPKINIYIPSNEHGKILMGFATDYHRIDEYGYPLDNKSKYIFYLWTRISNQSEKPITLLEVKFMFHNLSFLLDSKSRCNGYIPVSNNSTRSITPLIKPVLTLESYAAIEGYLFFGPSASIPPDGTRAKILVKTTRKTFKVKLRIEINRFNEELFGINQ